MEKKFPPDTPELLRSAVELETNLREDFRITERRTLLGPSHLRIY